MNPPKDEVEVSDHNVNVPLVQSVFKRYEVNFPPLTRAKLST